MPRLADLLGNKRDYLWAAIVAISLGGSCASTATFPYKWYNPAPASYEGTLEGPTQADDLPFTVCMPTIASQAQCVTMLASEFFKMKQDYLSTKQQLIDCQKTSPQNGVSSVAGKEDP